MNFDNKNWILMYLFDEYIIVYIEFVKFVKCFLLIFVFFILFKFLVEKKLMKIDIWKVIRYIENKILKNMKLLFYVWNVVFESKLFILLGFKIYYLIEEWFLFYLDLMVNFLDGFI